MKKGERNDNIVTRCLAFILIGMMCLGLAACGTVTEADSSIEAEAAEVGEEQVGAASLEVYFVLDEVTDKMTAYKINGGYYYISTEQAAAIAESLGENFSFADADGNVITVTSDGSYSSDTGKALLKVVGVGDVFADIEDMSLTVAITEEGEEETEEKTEEETGEETTASTSSSGSSSSSSGSSNSSSNSTSYSVSIWSCSESGHAWNDGSFYYDKANCTAYTKYKCMACGETKLEELGDDYHTWALNSEYVTVGYECYCGDVFDTYDELEAHWWTEDCDYFSNTTGNMVFNYTGYRYITEQVCSPECTVCGFTCTYEEYLEIIAGH